MALLPVAGVLTIGQKPKRSELAMVGIQLVQRGNMHWVTKPAFLRNVPFTAVFPYDAQRAIRALLGRFAKEAAKKTTDEIVSEINSTLGGGKASKAGANFIYIAELGRELPKVAAYVWFKMKYLRGVPAEIKDFIAKSRVTKEITTKDGTKYKRGIARRTMYSVEQHIEYLKEKKAELATALTA